MVHSSSIDSDHLAQIYEKQGRKAEAIRMYEMALASDAPAPEIRDRLAALAGPDSNLEAMTEAGRALLKEAKTIEVKNSHAAEGFADFWILLSPGSTVTGVKFVNGDEQRKPFEKELAGVSYPDAFPEATEMKLLRRGRLSCTHSAADCRLLIASSQSVSTEELPQALPTVAGDVGRVAVNGGVAAAKLLNSVKPNYPFLARQERVQGVVRLRAIIGKDGLVKKLTVISGHPDLLQAALEAVRQWKYQPTLLDGKPVEVDTTIDVIFQLTNSN